MNGSIDQLLNRLEGVRRTSPGYVARCPTHRDRYPSLSVDPGEKGWLVYCHAGCRIEGIMAAVGLTVQSLFYDAEETDNGLARAQATAGLNQLIAKVRGAESVPNLYRFMDVAWHTLPQEPRGFDLSLDAWWDEVTLPFGEAMRYWIVLRDGWLWDWMGETWMQKGRSKLTWHQFRDWMADEMDTTYRAAT